MLRMVKEFPNHQFILAATKNLPKGLYTELIGDLDITLVFDKTYDIVSQAEAALVTSGTATLETALSNTPQVVSYKANTVSYNIAKKLVTIKFISLVNLIMDREIVRELIQGEMSQDMIKSELSKIIKGGMKREQMLQDYSKMQNMVGGSGASSRAAKLMVKYLKSN